MEVVSAAVPDCPCATERLVGETASVKEGAPTTVNPTVAVCVTPPPVPVSVTV